MSRRAPSVDYLFTSVDIMCPNKHRVGTATKIIGQHPRAGTYGTDGRVQFQESEDVTPFSGRLRGTCATCGADVQIRWERVRQVLDANEQAGRHTDELTP